MRTVMATQKDGLLKQMRDLMPTPSVVIPE